MHIEHHTPLSPTEVLAASDKGGKKWGFLKKMSMGRMRSGSSPKEQAQQQQQYAAATVGAPVSAAGNRQPIVRAHTTAGRTSPLPPKRADHQLPQLPPIQGLPRPGPPPHTASAPLPRSVSTGSIVVGEDGALQHRSSMAGSSEPTTSPTLAHAYVTPSVSLPSISTTPSVAEEEEPEEEYLHQQPTSLQRGKSLHGSLHRKASHDALNLLSPPGALQIPLGKSVSGRTPSPHGLSPINTRAGRRRSFLPLLSNTPPPVPDVPSPNLSAHYLNQVRANANGPFVRDSAISASDTLVGSEQRGTSVGFGDMPPVTGTGSEFLPSPDPAVGEHDLMLEAEAHRQREAYKRGLRSVMAYLRDLSDLSGIPLAGDSGLQTGQNPASSPTNSPHGAVGRRPTINDGSFTSTTSSTHSGSNHGLKSKVSMISLRGGPTAGAQSVATSDTSGSGRGEEERKYKEDKKRRKGIIDELVT